MYLATINPELEQPNSILLQELQVRLRVRLRAQAPTKKTPFAHSIKTLHSSFIAQIDLKIEKNKAREKTAHRTERRLSVFKKLKLAVSGKPERQRPQSTIAKLIGGTKSSSSAGSGPSLGAIWLPPPAGSLKTKEQQLGFATMATAACSSAAAATSRFSPM